VEEGTQDSEDETEDSEMEESEKKENEARRGEDLSALTCSELRARCKERDLPVKGNKADLLVRLRSPKKLQPLPQLRDTAPEKVKVVSPVKDSGRAVTCWNCEAEMEPGHQCRDTNENGSGKGRDETIEKLEDEDMERKDEESEDEESDGEEEDDLETQENKGATGGDTPLVDCRQCCGHGSRCCKVCCCWCCHRLNCLSSDTSSCDGCCDCKCDEIDKDGIDLCTYCAKCVCPAGSCDQCVKDSDEDSD
jgi:hypothetical protein